MSDSVEATSTSDEAVPQPVFVEITQDMIDKQGYPESLLGAQLVTWPAPPDVKDGL